MRKPTTIHLGIDVRLLSDVLRLVPVTPVFDGDGWQVWGEDLGTSGNDNVTLHLQFHVDPAQGDEIVELLKGHVLPLGRERVIAVETLRDNWAVEEGGGRVWHRVRTLTRTWMRAVEYVVPEETPAPSWSRSR